MSTSENSNPRGVSAASLKIPAGQKKGGEGGASTPPSPPLPQSPAAPFVQDGAYAFNQTGAGNRASDTSATNLGVSNSEFAAAVFDNVAEGASVAVCSLPDNPNTGGWNAQVADNVDYQCPPKRNNYINCASFSHGSDGSFSTRKANFSAYHVAMVDDVGTKVPREKLDLLPPPSFEIESSPGNSQVGFILIEPITELAKVDTLQAAFKANGLGDIGSFGANRWMRLPVAINGKPKHARDDGSAFQCRLVTFEPTRRYTVTQLTPAGSLITSPRPIKELHKPTVSRSALESISHEVFTPAAVEHPVVTALKAKGLYKSLLGEGKHDITCPWVDEHTDNIDSGTAYFEPCAGTPTGGFKCQHSHGDALSVVKLLKELDISNQAARNKPEIRYVQGALDQVVKACDYILSTSGMIFQAGGIIVNLRRSTSGADARIEPAQIAELTMALAARCGFEVYSYRDKQWRRSDPPERVVRTLLGAVHYDYLPTLNGIARQPYYRPSDGTLVTEGGYDAVSGIYGTFNEGEVVLGKLTFEGAKAALSELEDLLAEFCFETPNDGAAALSAMCTATVRPSLPTAPAFLTSAPESGSGKSYLNSVIVQFAGGEPARASFPLTADEATKSFLAHLMSSPPCIEYDDMVCNFKPHAILNRGLTNDTITDRILSVSRTATVSTRTFIIGSGINVAPERDMNRRVITIKLASVPNNRIGRTFSGDPAALVRANRMKYVGLVLTIIEAWKAAGCPKSEVRPIASYGKEWSDTARHPLIWLGQPDPAQCLFDQVEDDSDGEYLQAFLQAWFAKFRGSPVPVRKVVQKALDETYGPLFDALEDLPCWDGQKVNRSKLGWYLSKNAKRIAGNLRLVEDRADGRRAWRVELVSKVETDTASPVGGSSS